MTTENTQEQVTPPQETAPDLLLADKPEAKEEPFEETGDAALDLALRFFQSNGIRKDNAAMKVAQQTGDFSLVEAILQEKGVKDAGAYVKVAKQQFEADRAKATAAAAATKTSVFSAVGGADNWAAIKQWAGENATPEETEAINSALSAGGQQAVMAARYLATAYDKAQASKPSDTPARKPDAARATTQVGGPLSPAEYQREMANLTRRSGAANIERNPEYIALRARREKYKG